MDNDLARKLATVAFDTINANMIEPICESWERAKREQYIDRVAEQLRAALAAEGKAA